ncbi:hypothetical protein ABK040_007302 [Willaertia magna]
MLAYKPLLDQINELENTRRLQECKLIEEKTRYERACKELQEAKQRLTNVKAKESLLMERVTRVESEYRTEMKAAEQLRQAVKYSNREEELFEKHFEKSSKQYEEEKKGLDLQLKEINEKYQQSIKIWESREYIQEYNKIKAEVEEYEKKFQSNDKMSEEQQNREKVKELQNEIQLSKEHMDELTAFLNSVEKEVQQVESEIQNAHQIANSNGNNNNQLLLTLIDENRALQLIQWFEQENSSLENEIQQFVTFNEQTLEDMDSQHRLLEALTQMMETNLCMNCLSEQLEQNDPMDVTNNNNNNEEEGNTNE